MVTITRKNDYRDLDLDFTAHPVTGDIITKTGPDAVGRAIRNLILTNFYDRPFRSYIGSNVHKMLFENMNSLTERNIESHVKDVISNFEPRVKVEYVKAAADIDHNGCNVKIVYSLTNRGEIFQYTVFLKRIR